MSSDLVIRARGVTKRYPIRTQPTREGVLARRKREYFSALDAIDLDIKHGEVLGLIGANGSGKSTLLKILSRITAPTEGVIDIWGRVGSLLEVGTGFHPELTGRENVYLNGSVLGMTPSEIDARFDSIVEFASIGVFLDTPVKRYSSGMSVRLAFAVAAHLNPEILLVDEVLAVGDAEFQRRCLGKMSDVATNEGRTVVFVSHNMAAIEHLCSRVAVIEHGKLTFVGDAVDAITQYLSTGPVGGSHDGPGIFNVEGKHVTRVTTTDGNRPVDKVLTGQSIEIVIDLKNFSAVRVPYLGVSILTSNEQVVFVAHTVAAPLRWGERSPDGVERVHLHIPDLPLLPGHYWVNISIKDRSDGTSREVIPRVAELQVVGGTNVFASGYQPAAGEGLVYVPHQWSLGVPAES